MTQTMAAPLAQISGGVLKEPPPRVLTDAAQVRALLRFMNVMIVCSAAPMTVAEVGRTLGIPMGRASYQVRQLALRGLLEARGPAGRGQRYTTPPTWRVPHTALPAEDVGTFLRGHFQRSFEVFAAAYEQHLKLSAQPWSLDLDFRRTNMLGVVSDVPGTEAWLPLIAHPVLRLRPERAAALHAELLNLLAQYGEEADEDGNDYFLGVAYARGLR